MFGLNGYRIRSLIVGAVAGIVICGGRARADFTFGTPALIDEPVNSSGIEYFDCISYDGLEVYIEKPVSGGIASSDWDIYVSTRETIDDPWSDPSKLGNSVNSSNFESYACISRDGLELYFISDRSGSSDIWVTKRHSKIYSWGTPVNLGSPINTSAIESTPWITPDDCELYFSSTRPDGSGNRDIWVSQRASKYDPWQTPVNLGPVVNSSGHDTYPSLSPSGLVLFFSDYDNTPFRPGGYGHSDMYMTRRKSTADPWEPPINLGLDMNTSSYDSGPRLSPDGSMLYFTSSRPGKMGGFSDIWEAQIIPIVDFNGDANVDAKDIVIMMEHWGEKYPLCDIGPMPLGDGIVDVLDLVVLTEYIDPIDRTLIAHWELEETEGDMAQDSTICDNDSMVFGSAIWQPDGGMVGGALHFDGIDDYVSTPFVLNPGEVSFSAIAWIRGGALGQVIISQADVEGQSAIESGSTWLGISPSNGNLMTGLMDTIFGPLESDSNITDGQWHHIGLVYDRVLMKRHLYVDGAEVVVDDGVVAGLQSTAGLYIGTGQVLDADTFFSGLIDDVRIYNQALSAEEIAALAQ